MKRVQYIGHGLSHFTNVIKMIQMLMELLAMLDQRTSMISPI